MDFDINLSSLGDVLIEGYEGEKLIITLSSSIYKDLQKDFLNTHKPQVSEN